MSNDNIHGINHWIVRECHGSNTLSECHNYFSITLKTKGTTLFEDRIPVKRYTRKILRTHSIDRGYTYAPATIPDMNCLVFNFGWFERSQVHPWVFSHDPGETIHSNVKVWDIKGKRANIFQWSSYFSSFFVTKPNDDSIESVTTFQSLPENYKKLPLRT